MKISKVLSVSLLVSTVFGAYIHYGSRASNSKSSTSPNLKPLLPIKNEGQDVTQFNIITGGDAIPVETVGKEDQLSENSTHVKDSNDGEEDISSGAKISVQCSQGNYQITSAAELDQLQQCDDIVGSVLIHDYQGATLDTGDIKTISGDLVISSASSLVRINTPKLTVVGGRFILNELTSLTSVHAPHLNTVSTIEWKVLPILSTVSFDSGIKSVKSIIISDTSLIAFSGFDSEVLDTLNINNNRFLESITTSLKGIDEKLSISANARNIAVSFPKLQYANNITIRDVSSLDVSNIVSVNKSLELINNNFQALKFPKLKSVGGTLSLIENWKLKDAEFPQVEDISGGLMIINNTYLSKLNFFPKLTSIGGAIKFIGDFRDASFGKLRVIKGSALLDTAADGFDCSKWTKRDSENGIASIIRGGSIVCRSSGKQQTVKYNNEGDIIDESILNIEDQPDIEKGHTNDGATLQRFSTLLAVGVALAFVLAV
jgi:hypothetical protein